MHEAPVNINTNLYLNILTLCLAVIYIRTIVPADLTKKQLCAPCFWQVALYRRSQVPCIAR